MSDVTIEKLQLEVNSNSQNAVSGIDALSASLSKLKTSIKGGVGLSSVARQITNLNTALNGMDSGSANKIDKLATSLSKLSSLGQLKISSSIGNQLKNIGQVAENLNTSDFSGLSKLGTALAPLANIQTGGLNKTINSLKKLPEVAADLNGVNWTQFTQQMMTLSNSLTPLATQLNTVSASMSKLPSNINRVANATNNAARANNTASKSYVNLWAKARMAMNVMRGAVNAISSWITESNKYIEDLNLFTASLGDYADEAKKYAEHVSEVMGIDPAEWMRNQGIFNTIIKGFGVASDRAYLMSKNLTQLGYDISSFYNISYEDAFTKLQSGIAGELEPLRRLGYDLSVARLQQEAYTLGIQKKVSAMTQAEKSELRYYAIMTQVTTAQGDMARTLNAPANQLRILQAQVVQCARALGNIFIPVLNAVLPYAIALAKVLRMVADAIASFFGFKLPKIDYSSLSNGASAVGDLAGNADDASDGLDKASKAAKKLKNNLLGIDELNIISPDNDDSSGSGSGAGAGAGLGGGGLGIELPSYDFLGDAITSKVDEISKKIKGLLPWIEAAGLAFASWKIADGVLKAIDWLSKMKGFNKTFGIGFKIAGIGLFLDAWSTMKEAIEDIQNNGANFTNVTKLISGFAEALGAAFILLGNVKLGGAMLVISGVSGIISDISDIVNNGVNWDNATSLTKNLGLFLSGIGMLSGNTNLGGIGLTISGIMLIVQNLKDLINAFETGDFSNVNWVEIAAGALMTIGGLILVFSKINTAAQALDTTTTAQTLTNTSTAVEELNTTISTSLSPKLTSLAKNLGLGLVIIAEISAAALLITGAIVLLGMELEQVGIAWQPVIDNGGTVAIAIGVGTGILAAVGVVAYALGTAGATVALNIGIGTAILLELGVAAGLFIAEIWAIGKGLDEIGKAWQPVLDNGETIATGIGLGTALLVGIGVVTAALGAATVASVGLLPLAIGLGTALLVELSAAFILFTESLVAVADELSNNLYPSLEALNEKLPTLSTDMENFVEFMTQFADNIVDYTKVSSIAGLSATIDTIIGWFTQDPINKLAGDIGNVYEQTTDLNEKLNLAVPELEEASGLLKKYHTFLQEIENLTASNPNLSNGQFSNMKEVGQKIVTGFVDGIKSKSSEFGNAGKEIINGFKTAVETASSQIKSTITTWGTNIKSWFTGSGYAAINNITWQGYGKNIVYGFVNGVNANYPISEKVIKTWGKNTVTWFKKPYGDNTTISDKFKEIGKYVVQGFIDGIDSKLGDARKKVNELAKLAKEAAETKLEIGSPSKLFKEIGGFVVEGFNIGMSNEMNNTYSLMNKWLTGISSYSPRLAFAVDTSMIDDFNPRSMAYTMGAEVQSNFNNTVSTDDSAIREIMREAMLEALNSSNIATDMRRQADKEENINVQVGNRDITRAVDIQREANGYSFT